MNKAEKEKLVNNLKMLKEKHVSYLREEADKAASRCERNVLRRLRSVNMTAQSVPIGDVLELERHTSPTMETLKALQMLQERQDLK